MGCVLDSDLLCNTTPITGYLWGKAKCINVLGFVLPESQVG